MDIDKERNLDLYDEIESDLPYLFGRASNEGHAVGQQLAQEVRTKMQQARAAIASQDDWEGPTEYADQVVASQGEPIYQCRDKLAVRWKDIAESEYNQFPESFYYRILYTAPPAAAPALSTAQIEALLALGQSWMSETGRDALDDWIAGLGPAVAPAPDHATALRKLMDTLGLKENDNLHDVLTAANIRIRRLMSQQGAAPAQAVDALGIKTWRQRFREHKSPWYRIEPKFEHFMEEEIAELRAALAAQQNGGAA